MGRFLTSRIAWEVSESRQVEEDFHLSAAPTVTTGFIGFAFDIRKVREVMGFRGLANATRLF
jgi:hypothetical protein